MKPVKQSDLEGLTLLGSILILDVTLWGASFVYETISRSPNYITTKTGNKRLPTEIWLEVISYAKLDIEYHVCKAIYPIDIQCVEMDVGRMELALICNGLDEWMPCRRLQNGVDIEIYEEYLNNPSRAFTETEYRWGIFDRERPFQVSKAARDPMYSIPLSHVGTKIGFLFYNVQVPDMISRLERGNCTLCWGDRRYQGVTRSEREHLRNFTTCMSGRGDCLLYVLCPLCIGGSYSTESAKRRCLCYHQDSTLSDEDFLIYANERFRELGYREWDLDYV